MPEPIYTLFTFDVEDTWYEDEIGAIVPTYLAETLTKHGIRAHFLLIGDRWRRIKERKEHRFVDALEHHDIGLHSDNAIEGPFISEVVADADWDQGVAIARSYEGRGLIAVEEACGRQASAISRHAHISGGPFSYEFARQKGLFYHYGYTPNPMGDVAPIWVAGALASDVEGPNYVTIHDCKYRSEETYQAEIKKFTDHVTRLQEEKVRFQTAFLGHPYCYMSHNGHVGSYYRYNGRSPRSIPETLAYMETLPCRRFPMSHLDDIKRRFRNTVEVIAGLRDQGLIKDVTTAELRDVFGKRPETMTLQQLQSFAKRIPHNGIDLPNPDIFTLGEYLLAMLECIERFNSSGTMPETWERCDVRAPRTEPIKGTEIPEIPKDLWLRAIPVFKGALARNGYLPATISPWNERTERLGLGHMLYAAAQCINAITQEGRIPETLRLPNACDKYPMELANMLDARYRVWRLVGSYREDVEPARISRYARLQLWDTCSACMAGGKVTG